MDQVNLSNIVINKEYVSGSKSYSTTNKIVNLFHNEVVRQILLGNKISLPGGMSVQIVRFETTQSTIRVGYDHKVLFRLDKLKKKKVKYIPATSLVNKLELVLQHTNFEFKFVNNGYK